MRSWLWEAAWDECKELPGIYRPSLGFELGLERICKRQIHVVPAQKNVFLRR